VTDTLADWHSRLSALRLPLEIVGTGRAMFAEVCRLGLEGLVAKRLRVSAEPAERCSTKSANSDWKA